MWYGIVFLAEMSVDHDDQPCGGPFLRMQAASSAEIPTDGAEMGVHVDVTEGETVYDAVWYPYARLDVPATCCFVTTARETPIHLWDSETGKVRA